ncbi:MAG: hypothetical protein ABSG43_02525 [Solirubrobacteraceae bacterium]
MRAVHLGDARPAAQADPVQIAVEVEHGGARSGQGFEPGPGASIAGGLGCGLGGRVTLDMIAARPARILSAMVAITSRSRTSLVWAAAPAGRLD